MAIGGPKFMENQIITATVRNGIGAKGFGVLDAGALKGIMLPNSVLEKSGFRAEQLADAQRLDVEIGPGKADGSFKFVCSKVHAVDGQSPAPVEETISLADAALAANGGKENASAFAFNGVVRNPIGEQNYGVIDLVDGSGAAHIRLDVLEAVGFLKRDLGRGVKVLVETAPGKEGSKYQFSVTLVKTVNGLTSEDLEKLEAEQEETDASADPTLEVGARIFASWTGKGFRPGQVNKAGKGYGFFASGVSDLDFYVEEGDLGPAYRPEQEVYLNEDTIYVLEVTRLSDGRFRNHAGRIVHALGNDVESVPSPQQQAQMPEKWVKRLERRKAVLARDKVTVVTETGFRLYGYPVGPTEWQCLPAETYVILFAEGDTDFSEPLSAFAVGKPRGTPERSHERFGVSYPEVGDEGLTKQRRGYAIAMAIFATRDGNLPVSVYTPEDLKIFQHRKRTVDHYVAVRKGEGYWVGKLESSKEIATTIDRGLRPGMVIEGSLDAG